MEYKRLTLLCGHYGSGKTNVALNMAFEIKEQGEDVAIADLDIVNPYFRSADNKELLEKMGVTTLVPEFANTNVDIPALPQNYQLLFNGSGKSIADVGGDGDGAAVLGLSPEQEDP